MSTNIGVTMVTEACACITIDRPEKRNALNEAAWRDLGDAFIDLSADSRVRAIILSGTAGAFCAGDDILAFASVQNEPVARQRYWDTIMRCYDAISATTVPVIAAVDGPSIGGGCTIALRADFRIAGLRAVFSVPPARLGLVYPAESTALLVNAVGLTFAKYMLYTGAKIDAVRACDIGLAMPATENDVMESALSLAEELINGAPLSIEAAKVACDGIALGKLEKVTPVVQAMSDRADRSNDYREGAAAFAAKRRPVFTGN